MRKAMRKTMRKTRGTILVDLHGTIANLALAVSRYKLVAMPPDLQWHDSLMDGIWKILQDPRLYPLMQPYAGAVKAMQELAKDYEIGIVTNSPIQCQGMARAWLDFHGIPYTWYMENENRCDIPMGIASPYILIDDRWENVRDFSETRGSAILVSRTWNSEHSIGYTKYPYYIAHSWFGIPGQVAELLTGYKEVGHDELAGVGWLVPDDFDSLTNPSDTSSYSTIHEVSTVPGGRNIFHSGAKRDAVAYRYDLLPPAAMLRKAQTLHEGALKYTDRNWEKGIPFSNLVNHLLAHIFSYCEGDRSEDHLAHASWGLDAMMHFEKYKPEMNDLGGNDGRSN